MNDNINALITYQQGTIAFPEYEQYLNSARMMADVLDSTELTEENVKMVKAELAAARSVCDALNRRRIEVKKAILAPYNDLEAQVNTITDTIRIAEDKLRAKVREMEEAEREEKRQALQNIWEKRVTLYTFPDYIPNAFEKWLQPKFLNKTQPMSKTEEDMTAYMEAREMEVQTIRAMPDADLILEAYGDSGNIAMAISEGRARQARLEKIQKGNTGPELMATFTIVGEKDIQLTELLLKTNNINYRRI